MIENKKFENRIDIKTSIANSQNVLISENDLNKIEKKNIKKRIIIINEKEELNSANSKRSNENVLLLKNNKINRNNEFEINNKNYNDDDYIEKFDNYFNKKQNLKIKRIETDDINNDETLNDNEKEIEIDNQNNKEKQQNNEKEKTTINEIFNLIIGYDIYKKIELNYIDIFFFNPIPEEKTLNTNINKIMKVNNTNNKDLNFNYNLEIIRNNKIYFFAKFSSTFPSINIKLYIKSPNEEYIKVGKIISNVLKNNFILYKGENKKNYKKVLNINYDLNFFGFKVRNMSVEKIENDKIKFILCNDSPEWDYEYKTYKLNFNGRVKKSCKKNFILKYKNSDNINNNTNINEKILQCGKIDDSCFALDFISPLSPFEAFSISLTSIINKFSCE